MFVHVAESCLLISCIRGEWFGKPGLKPSSVVPKPPQTRRTPGGEIPDLYIHIAENSLKKIFFLLISYF